MPRNFKLIDEKGQKFYMNNLNDYCFFENPTGLGVSYARDYNRFENIYMEVSKKREQSKPSGTALFSSYDNYFKFINFIENAEKLKLVYSIPFESGQKEYFRDVNVRVISKSEMKRDNLIIENLEFDCLSLWYEEKIITHKVNSTEDSDIVHWDFKWDSRFSDYDTGNLGFTNNGHVPATVLIELAGRVVNPKINVLIEGEQYQELTFNTTIEEFEKLLYSSKENDFYVLKENTDGTQESLFSLDVMDFSNDNVIRLPKNRSCELRFSSDIGLSDIKVTFFVYYVAV